MERRRIGRWAAGGGAAVLLVVFAVWLRGCPSSSPPIHLNPNMDDQPRFEAQEASGFFSDGTVSRPPVVGTVARGELVEDGVLATGRSVWSGFAPEVPLEVTPELLARGRDRYGVYCAPCHGEAGDGESVMLERGKVRTADLLEERIRGLRPGRIFQVVSEGKGLMPAYGYLLPTRDRWAVVAWVERLQAGAADGAEAAGEAEETAKAEAVEAVEEVGS